MKWGDMASNKATDKKNTADVGFEKQLWDAADVLRGNLDAAEYKNVVLGLIFLKYLSDRFDERYQELVAEGYGDEEDRDCYMEQNIFFVREEARWANIAQAAHTPEIGQVIDVLSSVRTTSSRTCCPRISPVLSWTSVDWAMLSTCLPMCR